MEEEEESSFLCVECEVPRELLLHRSKLIPPPVLGFERFEENKFTSIEKRGMIVQYRRRIWRKMVTHTQTHSQTCQILTQPVQGLGWVKMIEKGYQTFHFEDGFNAHVKYFIYGFRYISK